MANPPLVALREAMIGFGGRPTVTDASFGASRGERICLVGRNGSGKSSLMKALAGLIDLDQGERFVQPGCVVAYMPQEPVFDPTLNAGDYVAAVLPDPEAREKQRYKVDAVLAEFGIDPDQSLTGLSGGEGRRITLARLFVADPDVVLLDEPTNHLDIAAIEALEARLLDFTGAMVMVSHDRAFLTRLSDRVLWLDRGRLRSLDKGYAHFDEWSAGVLAAEEAEQARLDKKIAVETVWLHQGISARRTRNMGRVRALQALRRDRADRVTIGSVRLTGAETQAGGKLVVECEHIAKSFPPSNDQDSSYVVLKDFSTRVLRGDRVGIVGPNGAGKTTLLKILLGEIEPDKGKIRHGTNLMPAIFDQRREGLIAGRSVRETLVGGKGDTVFVQDKPRHVMSYLRDFLFEDRQAQQDVDRLSGGERNRLLLAKVLAQQSNVLVLDEPTNDLDMDTLDLLEEVLADYDGTLFLVSHDRDFLDRLVTSTIAVEGSGDVAEYVGGYTDYVRQRPVREKPRQAAAAVAPKPPPPAKPKPARLGFREQHDLERLPEMIDRLTAEKRRLEATLADAGLYARDAGAFTKATGRLGEVQHELEAAEERWLDLELKRADLEG